MLYNETVQQYRLSRDPPKNDVCHQMLPLKIILENILCNEITFIEQYSLSNIKIIKLNQSINYSIKNKKHLQAAGYIYIYF